VLGGEALVIAKRIGDVERSLCSDTLELVSNFQSETQAHEFGMTT
jgi:hypothetical protein